MKAFLTKLKNVIIGKELWIRKQCRVPLVWCGNDYGGFYISPLPDMKNIYSFGIGTDISFDLAIIEKFNVEIFAFDPTPKSIDWIKNKGEIRKFHFYPIGLSNFDGKAEFHLPKNPEYVSGSAFLYDGVKTEAVSVEMKRLSTIISELKHKFIDVLKLDIEGSEFDVIEDISISSSFEDNSSIIYHSIAKQNKLFDKIKLYYSYLIKHFSIRPINWLNTF